jgi:3',5'-cyclic AMP phosphodiesterase CpdA
MDRRQFLKSAAGAGALIATSSLPMRANDNPSLFPKRGGYERLSLSYATVHIGLEKPFSVLHCSDTHLTAAYPHEDEKKQTLHKRRAETFGGQQEEALRDTLAWAKEHVDYVVHTGDLIDWQSEANFDLVRKYLGQDVLGSVGNHEFSTDMWLSDPKEESTESYKDNTRRLVQRAFPFNVEFQSQVANGVNFITLDDAYGYVTERQVALFDVELKRGLPIVLCIHVPFFTDDIWRANHRFWSEKEKNCTYGATPPAPTGAYLKQQQDEVTRTFIARLKQEPLLKAILSGHAHITVQEAFSPYATQYVVAGNFLFHAQVILFV